MKTPAWHQHQHQHHEYYQSQTEVFLHGVGCCIKDIPNNEPIAAPAASLAADDSSDVGDDDSLSGVDDDDCSD